MPDKITSHNIGAIAILGNNAWVYVLKKIREQNVRANMDLKIWDGYFDKFGIKLIKTAQSKAEELAKKEYKNFDPFKTVLSQEIINQALLETLKLIDTESQRTDLLSLDPEISGRLKKLEEELEIASQNYDTKREPFKSHYQRMCNQLMEEEEYLKHLPKKILEIFKEGVVDFFKERLDFQIPKEATAEIHPEFKRENRK